MVEKHPDKAKPKAKKETPKKTAPKKTKKRLETVTRVIDGDTK